MAEGAEAYRAGDLLVTGPYAPAGLAGVRNTAAYLHGICNLGARPDRLLGASASVAEQVRIHGCVVQAGAMRLRDVAAIELPPGTTVSLRHGRGFQLMLVGLRQLLKPGDRFELTLHFGYAGRLTVDAHVQIPRILADAGVHPGVRK